MDKIEKKLNSEINDYVRQMDGVHSVNSTGIWYKGKYERLYDMAKHFYELGKKEGQDELKKDAIHCNVFWYDGPLLDYTQEQQDDDLERIGAHVDDKVMLIILKDE